MIKQRHIVAYLDSVHARLASHKGMISLRRLQSATGEELRPLFGRTLLPSVLDRALIDSCERKTEERKII